MGRPQATVPPWHLWGNTVLITVPPSSLFVDDPNRIHVASTIIKVEYGRPETWRFQYQVSLASGPTAPPTITVETELSMQLITGVGRGVMRRGLRPAGHDFDLRYGGEATPVPFSAAGSYWINAFDSGLILEGETEDATTNLVTSFQRVPHASEYFVAETITVQADVFCNVNLPPPVPLDPVVVEVSFQVAPVTHIRPDWYEIDPVFSGETEGR